jgi:hypothetical protein
MSVTLSLLWSDAAVAGMFMGPLSVGGIAWYWGYKAQRGRQRNPLARHLLRSPGQSRLEKIDELRWDVAAYMGIGMLPAPVMLAVYLEAWASLGERPGWLLAAICALLFVALQSWAVLKLFGALGVLRRLRLGHEAELAAGQELNDLARLGYRVFHDLSLDDGRHNVDHVLVGPGGVFVVETKGRDGERSRALLYNGEALEFPGWEERKPLLQAVSLASRVQGWLSFAVGETVRVQAVLVLPGWSVTRVPGEGIPVLGGGEIGTFFSTLAPAVPLSGAQIERIAKQLDRRCRELDPPEADRWIDFS